MVMGTGGNASNFLVLVGIAGTLLVSRHHTCYCSNTYNKQISIRYVSWPVIGTGLLCYGLFYCYERLRWTDAAQRNCFNQQFVEYLQSKLKHQVSITGHSQTRIIERCAILVVWCIWVMYQFIY